MQKQVFKDEFKPLTAGDKKQFHQLIKDLREANKNPRFRKFVEEMKMYHLGLKK